MIGPHVHVHVADQLLNALPRNADLPKIEGYGTKFGDGVGYMECVPIRYTIVLYYTAYTRMWLFNNVVCLALSGRIPSGHVHSKHNAC